MTAVLGISGYYHDSAAAIVIDGRVEAAVQQERFSRVKNDARFPVDAIRWCLESTGIETPDHVVFYDKPLLTMDRVLETQLGFAPMGLSQFVQAMPRFASEKLFLKQHLRRQLDSHLGLAPAEILFTAHHQAHAGSAFFASPFEDAAVLCIDGVGEWASTSAWHGRGNELNPLWELRFPHSLGLLYSAFTWFCGFAVNDGEYKLMGLAPYGEPRYVETILGELLDLKDDGTFRLDMRYFDYGRRQRMVGDRFAQLWGNPRRDPSTPLRQLDMDLAASIQQVTTLVVQRLAHTVRTETSADKLCLAGGVALNCVATGQLRNAGDWDEIWVQPAAGDAGGAVGAALCCWHQHLGHARVPAVTDGMNGMYLGPGYSDDEIRAELDRFGAQYTTPTGSELRSLAADAVLSGDVVGWFDGRMEFGPRALGNRSILADPRNDETQRTLNLKIKKRESFRPFAPVMRTADAAQYFVGGRHSRYMTFVDELKTEYREVPVDEREGVDRVNNRRSRFPAITHLDYSARLQTVDDARNPKLAGLLEVIAQRTGDGVLVNTSFNVKDEPIVMSPSDAYRCFMATGMDHLAIGGFWLSRSDQPGIGEVDAPDQSAPLPDSKTLRHFSRTLSVLVAIFGGVLVPQLWLSTFSPTFLVVAALLLTWGEIAPSTLGGFYRGWFRLAELLNRIVSPVLFALIYFVLVVPLGLTKQLSGAIKFSTRADANRQTYRDEPLTHNMSDPF